MSPSTVPLRRIGALLAIAGVAACSSVEPVPIALSIESTRAKALDRPYDSVVALPDPALETSTAGAFGPVVGRYFLTGDFAVYRHLKAIPAPLADPSATAEVLGTVAPDQLQTVERLTYFLVNPDGIVTGVASGQVQPDPARCIQVEFELPVICNDIDRLEANLREFDAAVRTSDGFPISVWTSQQPTGETESQQ